MNDLYNRLLARIDEEAEIGSVNRSADLFFPEYVNENVIVVDDLKTILKEELGIKDE